MSEPEEFTVIIDTATGDLTLEGLTLRDAASLSPEYATGAAVVNCARPLRRTELPAPDEGGDAERLGHAQIFSIYHNSMADGPGRRSVVQFAGCSILCKNCFVPETHDPLGGERLPITQVLTLTLSPEGEPRDGVTILGGEPFDQPQALATLVRELKARGEHITVYTGRTIEELRQPDSQDINTVLALADLLIDGPFVVEQSDRAGEWRGSRNQRIIQLAREPVATPPRNEQLARTLEWIRERNPQPSLPESRN